MLKNCPDPVDEQAVHFKLQCRLKVFDNSELDRFSVPHNLVACASRYGLLFVGTNSPNLQAIQCSTLANYSPKDKDISDYPHRNLTLPSTPRHVSVNCDHTIVAVVIEQDKCPVAIFYDVLSFYKQQIQPLTTVRLSANPGTFVTEVNWNPALPPFFTACKSDGSIGIYELKGVSVEINEIPPAAEASTFCWSPKGKQIAVGSKKGTITQYKPDLKAVRMINAPPLGEAVSLISLQWISNYQFIGIYQPKTDDAQAKLIVVDAPKTGETVYTNYDDVCYSGSSRIPQFFMILQPQWNILMVASSNSAELAVLGLTSPDSWTQWMISDSSRAELPLSTQRQETLPVGLSIDISNTKPFTWGESTLAPPPYVLMLSHQGVLCIFNFVNLKNVPSICTPPDPIQDQSGLSEFSSKPTTASEEKPKNEPSQQPSTEIPKKSQIQLPGELQPKPTTSPALQINPLSFSFSTAPVTPTTQSKSMFSFTTPTQTQSGLFGEKTQPPQSLFSGQATLTPIKPQTVANPMFDQISITPINKTQPSSGKNLVDERYTSIFSALNTPQSSASIPAQVKPIILSTTNKSSNPPEFPVSNLKISTQSKPDNVAILKPESSTASKPDQTFVSKSVAPSAIKSELTVVSKPVSEPSKIETEAILQNMIKEECRSLEAELTAMTQKGKKINVNVGSEDDKIELLDIIKNLEEFLEEITEISAGEYSEIHTLKQNVVLSWAWYEEALSRYNTSKNDMMKLLIKSQPLDSATEKRYSDIKKLIYYIESQLLQVSRALDEQWDKFQDYVKKTYKVQTPTMEAIYQAMVRQNGILQKQGYFVKDISNRLKKKQQISGGTLLLSVDNISLEDELKKLQVDTHDDKYQLYKKAVMQSKKLSSVKSKKLHTLLKNREVVHITSIKSFIPSETFQSPNKRLSLLGAKMSPVQKFLEPKQIDFSQSTPYRNFIPVGNSTNSTISEIQTIKPLNFKKLDDSKTIEVPVTNNAPAFSFTSTTRSQLTSSNLPSAFVSTAQTTSVSKEQNLSMFSTPPNITQKIPSEISNPKTTTNKQVSFSSNVGVGMQKPLSSVPGFGFSGTSSFPAFSFGTTPNKTITSTANTFLNKGNEASTPAEKTGNSFPALSLTKSNTTKANDTPNLFGSAMPKTVTTSPSFIQTTEKPKTETNVPTRNVLSLKPSTTTTTIPPSNTFSFAANTANSTGTTSTTTSFQFGTTPKPTATSIFAATSTPVTTMSLFTSQTTSPLLVSVSNTPTSSSSIAATTKVSSSESAASKQVITCTAATSAIPASTTTVVKTTSSMTFQSVTTNSTFVVSPTAALSTSSSLFSSPTTTMGGSIFGAASTSSSFSFINSGSSTLFGNATTASNNVPSAGIKQTTTSSLFSAISSPTTVTTSPLFGTSTTTVSTIPTVAAPATSTTVAAISTVGTQGTSTTAAASPLFGKTTSVSAPSLFGTPPTTTTSVTSIFGSSASNTVSAAPVLDPSVSKAVSTAPLFGTSTSTPAVPISSTSSTVSSASTFGTSAAPTSVCTSSTFGVNSSVPSPSSFFGSGVTSTTTKSTPSIFGPTTTSGTSSSSIFGSNDTTVKSTTGTIFGSNTSNPLFGSNSAVSSPTSIFSNVGKAESTSSSPSIFGQSSAPQATAFAQSPSISSSTSIFGTPTTTQTSIFGAAATTTTQSFSVGGSVNQGSIFGSAATTSASVQPSVFGSTATSAANSVFGSSTSSPSIFATTTAPNSSPFSQPATNTFGSAFGGTSSSPALPTSSSVFGAPATFGSSTGSIFGSTPTTTSGSIFGNSTSGSSFGAVTSGSIFGSTAASSFSFASPAGTAGESALNFGSLNVNTATTTPGSVFGGGSIFGSATTASNPNPFGKTPEKTTFGSGSNLFGNTPTSSPFGSNTAFGASNQSTFGSTGFGQQPQQQQQQPPTFGQSTFGSSSFGSSQPGPFSGGSAGVGQSGFGSPAGFQKPPSAFGSPPAFGGSPAPAFGGSPSFGGAPAFGAAPSFGSPTKIFGSNTATAAFGSASTGSPGFGNLANQETIGFGNLAKQAANSPSSGFSGNSSFSSWR